MRDTSQVFLSYSHRDSEWVRKFAERLTDAGIRVWTDEEIALGDPIAEKLEDALRASDSLVIVLRPENLNSPNFYFELGVALAKKNRLIAIVADDVAIEQLPESIRRRKFLQMQSPEETAKDVVEVLSMP